MSYCETQNLSVGYREVVQTNICLEAQKGRILGIIGPNGTGKSTLLKTLAGQLAQKSGTLLLDGREMQAFSAKELAQRLAFFQPGSFPAELIRCFDVAAFGRYPYTGQLGILSETDRAAVYASLEKVHASQLAEREFTKISDGQRQRVLLARAICQEPALLLLDEPMSFLDIKGKIELTEILKKLAKEDHIAIILTMHELNLARSLADDIVCVGEGGVSPVMSPEEAFSKENICRLFHITEEQYRTYM